MSKSITLTREQVSKISTWISLSKHITQIRIVEKMTTGIGADHIVYFMDENKRVWNDMDITDTSTW